MTPLIVDVDGTLIRSDLLIESALHFMSRHPLSAWRLLVWLAKGKAFLKAQLATHGAVDVGLVPLAQPVVDAVRAAQAQGRPVHLASASDHKFVEGLAQRLNISGRSFASDGIVNLAGAKKADALVEAFGEGGFDYIGNDQVDMAVWDKAGKAIYAGSSSALAGQVASRFENSEHIKTAPRSALAYARALRPHQWSKNALVGLPMLVMHKISVANILQVGLAFVAFSLIASSVYLINDLADLDSDRKHSRKHKRPFASGDASLIGGAMLIPLLGGAGFAAAALVGPAFLVTVSAYFLLTLAYSFNLKRRPVADVISLGGLYMVRVFAGGVAIGALLSPFMLGFSLFFFLCLALVKRWAELLHAARESRADPAGRGYRAADIPLLAAFAVAAGYSSVVILALYITSEPFSTMYHRPEIMWFSCVIVLYWISRTLIRTHRGEMHDDPVVFALTDRPSYVMVAGVVALALIAAY